MEPESGGDAGESPEKAGKSSPAEADAEYACPVCGDSFSSEAALRGHMGKKDPEHRAYRGVHVGKKKDGDTVAEKEKATKETGPDRVERAVDKSQARFKLRKLRNRAVRLSKDPTVGEDAGLAAESIKELLRQVAENKSPSADVLEAVTNNIAEFESELDDLEKMADEAAAEDGGADPDDADGERDELDEEMAQLERSIAREKKVAEVEQMREQLARLQSGRAGGGAGRDGREGDDGTVLVEWKGSVVRMKAADALRFEDKIEEREERKRREAEENELIRVPYKDGDIEIRRKDKPHYERLQADWRAEQRERGKGTEASDTYKTMADKISELERMLHNRDMEARDRKYEGYIASLSKDVDNLRRQLSAKDEAWRAERDRKEREGRLSSDDVKKERELKVMDAEITMLKADIERKTKLVDSLIRAAEPAARTLAVGRVRREFKDLSDDERGALGDGDGLTDEELARLGGVSSGAADGADDEPEGEGGGVPAQ